MQIPAYKLGYLSDGVWQEHVHKRVFRDSALRDQSPRIEATLPHGDHTVFARLAECMTEPCFVLYVLHTPRGEGKPGRYQSPPLTSEEMKDFIEEFGTFFSCDSRFDLWIHSPTDQSTLVWDRHNLIYAYGIKTKFLGRFKDLGYTEGLPEIPAPHEHHYRKEFDADAARLLARWDWSHSALRPDDEQ